LLYLHEVHDVVGSRADEFEAAFSGEWMPLHGYGDDARLLWYLDQAHGSGPSYRVVTVTAVRDGAAWESLTRRIQEGDLKEWMAGLDRLRHDVRGRLLLDLDFSPLRTLELSSVRADPQPGPATHERHRVLYMEDTMWPHEGMLGEYIEHVGRSYADMLQRPSSMLTIDAAWRPALGAGRRREVTLLQRVKDPSRLLRMFETEVPPSLRAPGTWMHDALRLRDKWESRLLRAAPWSPMLAAGADQ
jgi:hypothetical protein